MGPQTYYLRSFGCQMNEHDSERIAGLLEEMGLAATPSPEDADLSGLQHLLHHGRRPIPVLAGHLGTAARLKKERSVAPGGGRRLSGSEPAGGVLRGLPLCGRAGGTAEPARAP